MRRIFASRIRDMSVAEEVVVGLSAILAYDPNHAGLQELTSYDQYKNSCFI